MNKQKSFIGSVNDFYSDLASLYAEFSKDRDFYSQVKFFRESINTATDPISTLELCAGPAEHSIALKNHFGALTWAVDSSETMQTIAIESGFSPPDQYLVSQLPNVDSLVNLKEKFDGLLLLRYSIGYLTPLDVKKLFTLAYNWLKFGGIILIEIHPFKNLLQGLKDLSIRERRINLPDGTFAQCIWPSGELEWEDDDWIVNMPLSIQLQSQSGDTISNFNFFSREYIYTVNEINRIADAVGGFDFSYLRQEDNSVFPESSIIVLRKNYV